MPQKSTQLHQRAGGIVNEGDEAALARTILKPGVWTAVNLHQLAQAATALAWTVDAPDA